MGSTDLRVPVVSDSELKDSLFIFRFDAKFENDKLSSRCPFFVKQICLCSLGSVVFYKNMICTVSDIFIGDLNVFR